MKLDIFNIKYNGILHPFNLESIEQLAVFIKAKDSNNLTFHQLKELTIDSFQYLIDNDIIYVLESKWMNNKEYNKTHLSNEDIINTINEKWLPDICWDEFYDLFWFKFQDWYTTELSKKGLTYFSINWNEFINEKIGNLEQWIQENKPKK